MFISLLLLSAPSAANPAPIPDEKACVAALHERGGVIQHLKDPSGGYVAFVDLMGPKVTDDDLRFVAGIAKLYSLNLQDARITDAGLEQLEGLDELSALYLNGTQITGAGLTHLQGLAQLQSLILTKTAVDDDGLANLEGLEAVSKP